ncbi:pyruvate decarboxylase-2 [Actinidia rufa]|uniref:Pyruvate decarboxylase-2 n=1 Tax=Actinidia rufa TaxID=165716 RepID=A0A7J0DW52_9ERIC|nr:pyruvate decarboxylase-2 [Actinidia rufa]
MGNSDLLNRLGIGVTDVFSIPDDFHLALLDHLITEPGLTLVGCCNELNVFSISGDFNRYASLTVGNAFLTRLERVSVAFLRKKRRFAVFGGIRHLYTRILQLRCRVNLRWKRA